LCIFLISTLPFLLFLHSWSVGCHSLLLSAILCVYPSSVSSFPRLSLCCFRTLYFSYLPNYLTSL
jgi:hypothetical protein